ncbi:hypothetical protein LNP25_21165 [Klebsiella variicola subsp. variicola]|nr:hypothetical protein [Klebsiella variicola subsp. variicola]
MKWCVLPGQHPLAQQTEIHWQDIPTRDLVYITTDARLVAMIAEEVPAPRQRRGGGRNQPLQHGD